MPVGVVAFAPDCHTLATVCYPPSPQPHDRWAELRIWELATGRERRSERRVIPNQLLIISEGGERLVVNSVDEGTRPLADLARWPERLVLDRMGGVYCRSALSPDGRTLATARHRPDRDRDTRVRLWDVATGRLIKTLDDGELVDMLDFSPDGRTLAGAQGQAGRLGRRLRLPAGLEQDLRRMRGTVGVFARRLGPGHSGAREQPQRARPR